MRGKLCGKVHASSVSVGRAYELLVLAVLRRYSFQLVHSGRPGDGGVDFMGHWALPNTRVDIVGQCKHHQSPLGPRDVREFESAVQRLSRPPHTVTGILVSHSGFSRQAAEAGLNSDLPLILGQIRPSTTDRCNTDITTTMGSGSSNDSKRQTMSMTQQRLGRSSNGVGTSAMSPQGTPQTRGSKLMSRGLPLSQLGFTLRGNEEHRIKCLWKKGYFSRSLPKELSSGYISDFVMNHTMRTLYPGVSVVWRWRVEGERGGVGGRRDILMLFRCPVGGSVYDLGAVSRRHTGSGEPTAWKEHSSNSAL